MFSIVLSVEHAIGRLMQTNGCHGFAAPIRVNTYLRVMVNGPAYSRDAPLDSGTERGPERATRWLTDFRQPGQSACWPRKNTEKSNRPR
jgi:hypothetical protein